MGEAPKSRIIINGVKRVINQKLEKSRLPLLHTCREIISSWHKFEIYLPLVAAHQMSKYACLLFGRNQHRVQWRRYRVLLLHQREGDPDGRWPRARILEQLWRRSKVKMEWWQKLRELRGTWWDEHRDLGLRHKLKYWFLKKFNKFGPINLH